MPAFYERFQADGDLTVVEELPDDISVSSSTSWKR